MTPHESHSMGIVAGETCCRICHAAPWMPLVESECYAGGMKADELDARLRGSYREREPFMTLACVQEAQRLRAEGLTWAAIGKRLDRPSMRIAVREYAAGRGRLARLAREGALT